MMGEFIDSIRRQLQKAIGNLRRTPVEILGPEDPVFHGADLHHSVGVRGQRVPLAGPADRNPEETPPSLGNAAAHAPLQGRSHTPYAHGFRTSSPTHPL